jgi:hypothetical protein
MLQRLLNRLDPVGSFCHDLDLSVPQHARDTLADDLLIVRDNNLNTH